MSEEIEKKIKNQLASIAKSLKLISIRINEISNFYFDFGWFFDYELPFDNHMYKIFKEENYLIDGYMIMHFNDYISEIEKLLLERFLNRSEILIKAFEAHRNKNYELSIPIFIIQSDGIFREITNKELFSKRENQRAELLFNEIDKKDIDYLRLSTINVFKRYEQLSASFTGYTNYPNMLHRNLILHGYQNDYATETNAYKALSLLNFVGKIVYDFQIGIKKTPLCAENFFPIENKE